MRPSTATRFRLGFAAVSIFAGFAGLALTEPESAEQNDGGSSLVGKVVVVRIDGEDLADGRRFKHLRDLLNGANQASAIVFDLNVTGASPWETQRRLLEEIPQIQAPTYAYVNPSALSSGAVLAIGTDTIYFAPAGVIGGAAPNLENGDAEISEEAFKRDYAQQLSVLEARARSLAKLKGHDPDVVKAFIDSDFELKRGKKVISPKGSILTLTADEAVEEYEGKPLLGKGIVGSIEELIKAEGLKGEKIETTPETYFRDLSKPARDSTPLTESATDADESESDAALFSRRDKVSYAGKILVLPIRQEDLIIPARFEFMERAIKKAALEKASGLIIDMNTPGGAAWQTAELMMKSLAETPFPTITFVNPNAVSAGSLIAVSTDTIYMYPASNIGSALVVSGTGGDLGESMQQKVDQMMISTVRNVAELKGHNPDVAEAFVNKDKEVIIDGVTVSKAGTVLNLNANEATEVLDGRPVLAKGIARTVEEIIEREGLKGERFDVEPTGMEAFAEWVQKFSFLLIILGVAGAYTEINAPGFGVPGVISLLAFGLFFFGNYAAGNLAGYELAVLLVIGLLLIGVEIFVLPGTVIPGVVGAVLVLTSIAMAMVDRVDFEYTWKGLPGADSWGAILGGAATTMALGLIGAVALILLAMRFLPESRAGSWMILKESIAGGASIPMEEGGEEGAAESESKPMTYVGLTGVASTDLRPAGKGSFGVRHLDIISDGEFIEKGTPLKVVKHEGSRIVVVRT
ncbi:MAG: hypothetical protein KDN19_11785 [Verrucomicrobiae bacterium]|nr:hypothetical protein [Verrucomicrobiae bacterium]